VQQQSATIQIDASRDRARLDAKANAQQERLKAMAEAEARERAVRLSRGCRPRPIPARRVPPSHPLRLLPHPPQERERAAKSLEAPTHERAVATNVLMKQKRVMDLLNVTRKPMSTAELHNELGFPVDSPELWDMLLHNDKVSYNEQTRRFSYRAKHVLADRREMLALVQKHPDGILLDDVADAYAAAAEDAEALVAAGAAVSLVNAESREKVLYPVDDAYEVEVEEEIAGMFHAVAIPSHDPDFDAALRNVGAEPAPRRSTAPRAGDDDSDEEGGGKAKKKKKKRRAVNFERMKVTNVHLPELFKAPQVERLDG
jgi:transcription initiation factor TFIIE subunit beta